MIFGGPHATLDPKSILTHVPQGLVVVGDGEKPFTTMVTGGDIWSTEGIVYVDDAGNMRKTGLGLPSVAEHLDELPWVDRSLLANEPYVKDDKRTMTLLGSRGCVGSCSFCVTPAQYSIMREGGAKKMRFRNMEDVVREAATLKQEHGLEVAQFIDDDMLPSVARVRDFIRLWNEYGLQGTEFVCLLRPDQIVNYGKNGLLHGLQEAGLKKISLGIETGHDRGRVMLSSRKDGGIDRKYIPGIQLEAVRCAADAGIETKGFFMIGLPGETRDEINETLRFIRQIGDAGLSRIAVFPVKVYPNTELWDAAIAQGFTPEQLEHYDAPNVRLLIEAGVNPQDASRDGFVQTAQLSEVPNAELAGLCQEAMDDFKKRS